MTELKVRSPPTAVAPEKVKCASTYSDLSSCCPICLEQLSEPVTLQCGHGFCMHCLERYGEVLVQQLQQLRCPCCGRTVPEDELAYSLPNVLEAQRSAGCMTDQPEQPRAGITSQTADRDRDLARAAGWAAVRLRYCPSCSAPVFKAGGCDHMRCICGCHFSWWAARPVSRPQMLVERAVMTAGTLAAAGGYVYFCVRLRGSMSPLLQKLFPGCSQTSRLPARLVERWVRQQVTSIALAPLEGLARLAITHMCS